jgi:hypothetical protein
MKGDLAGANRLSVKLQITLPAKKIINHFQSQSGSFFHLKSVGTSEGKGGLKFKTMKKQILILAMFTLALIFAGTSTVLGQALLPGITGTNPIDPLSCASGTYANFLHPIAGQTYTYQMDDPGPEIVSNWTWFATKDPNFVTGAVLNTANMLTVAPGQLLNTSVNYGVAGAADNVQITWTPQILTNTLYQGTPSTTVFPSPTFVVGYGTGTNCADNIKVYEINPIINFTIDIANIDTTTGVTQDWDFPITTCVDKVQSATYTAGKDLLMDYGKNVIYFEVAAANFTKDFTPVFRLISGLSAPQTAEVSVYASYANARAGTSPIVSTNWTSASVGADWATATQFTATNATDIAAGVSLFVKVIIRNTTFESLAANPFVLAVDARDNTNTGKWDLADLDCTTPTDAADRDDQASNTINPRPTITGANIPDSNPALPNNIVPKNP